MMLSSLLLLGCAGSTAPTAPTPSGDDETGTGLGDGTGLGEISLADQVKGTFIGYFVRTPAEPNGVNLTNYEIIVTYIDDTSVRVAPASGSGSATFVANLESAVDGSVTYIKLTVPSDIVENNGSFSVVSGVGRLSYIYHLGGSNQQNAEIFAGARQ